MKTVDELLAWLTGGRLSLGDPSAACAQAFFRWQDPLGVGDADLVCCLVEGQLMLVAGAAAQLPVPIATGEPQIGDEGVEAFGALRICPGVWALAPSLNVPGVMHYFVVLYDVPEPPPWERRIVLASRIAA
jgi:hypothetical protein